ncbi:MAG TPA: FGGY family carbohydrate kinase, partial [Candidatus Anoxymicrobiaceae bacterium]
MAERYALGYDVGTGGCKAVLATLDGVNAASEFEPYDISYPREHFAEQDPADWWRAVAASTRRLLEKTGTDPSQIAGLAFSSQMLGVVAMDAAGTPLRPGIIWMDCRAEEQARKVVRKLGGARVMLQLFGAVPSGKDVMCKLKWLKEEEPDIFDRTRVFLDVKGYVVYRATGNLETDQTAASVTGLMDNKTRGWSGLAARLLGASLERMPEVKKSADVSGGL